MEDDDWESYAEATKPVASVTRGRFADEEEEDDDDVLDSWDTVEDEKKPPAVPVSQPKKKITLGEKIAKREQLERERQAALAAADKEEDPVERQRRMREAELRSDLQNAADLFGDVSLGDGVAAPQPKSTYQRDDFTSDLFTVDDDDDESKRTTGRGNAKQMAISEQEALSFGLQTQQPAVKTPKTKKEFDDLRDLLLKELPQASRSSQYIPFVQELMRGLCQPLSSDEVRLCTSKLNALSNDKARSEKAQSGGAKKKTAAAARPQVPKAPVQGKANSKFEYGDYAGDDGGDDFDDFM